MASTQVEKEVDMKFPDYVAAQVKKQQVTKTQFMRDFAKASGVAFATITSLSRGLKMVRYDKAKQVSDATGNKVTVKELCEKDD